MLLQGLGLHAGYLFNPGFEVKLFASKMTLKPASDGPDNWETSPLSTKHEITKMGLEASYFFLGIDKSSPYLSLAAGQVTAKSTGRIDLSRYSLFSSVESGPIENSVERSKTLAHALLGYRLVAREMSGTRFSFRGALGYTNAGKYSVNYGGTENTIEDGTTLELIAALNF